MYSYNLYLLENTENTRTYLGITNNLERRIRQHNGELSGGAKYTYSFRGIGKWKYHLYISNLTKSEALSIERSVKNTKKGLKGTPIERRKQAIEKYLHKFPNCNKILLETSKNDCLMHINEHEQEM